jgi:hypothetical protein
MEYHTASISPTKGNGAARGGFQIYNSTVAAVAIINKKLLLLPT